MSASAAIADVPLTRDVCVVDAVFPVYSVYLVAGISRIEQTKQTRQTVLRDELS
jgi:hypothetical protein